MNQGDKMKIVVNWWSTISFAGQIIIFLIALLFMVSFLMIIYHILRFAWRERKSLKRVEKNFINLGFPDELMEKSEICLQIIHRGKPRSIVVKQVQRLKSIVKQNPSFNYAEIAELAYMKENSRWSLNIVKFSRVNLVVLGLLGTFLGLSLLVGDIDTVFATIDARNVKALLDSFRKATKEMAHIIVPMQTAFSTSLVGLLGTLLLSFFITILDWTRKKFFTRMESFFITNLIPLLTVKDEAGIADDLKIAAGKLDNVSVRLSDLSGEIADDMEHVHQIVNIFETSTAGIIKSQENLLKLIQDMEFMIHEVREDTRLSREEGIRLLNTLDVHLKNMDEFNQRFVQLQMNFDTWISKLVTPFNKQQQDFTHILQGAADANKKILSQLSREITLHYDAINNTFKQHMETYKTFVEDTTRDYGQNMKTAVTEVLEGFESYESTMMEISEKLKTVAEDLKDFTQISKNLFPSNSNDKQSAKNLDNIKETLEDMFALSEKKYQSLNTIVKIVSSLKSNSNFNHPREKIGDNRLEKKSHKRNLDFGSTRENQNSNESKVENNGKNEDYHHKRDTDPLLWIRM
jgi:hypothetical protein